MTDSNEETIDTSSKSSFTAHPRTIDRPMSAIKLAMMQKRVDKEKNSKAVAMLFD
jgi:hypothetical protein